MRHVCTLVLVLAACAKGGLPLGNLDLRGIDLGPADLGPADLAGLDLAGIGCIGMVKVNEVQTGGGASGTDEFIELYNACGMPVNLVGAKLAYRSATNAAANDTGVIAALAGTLQAGGYLLVANAGYAGAATPDIQPFEGGVSGLAPAGGGVGLRDAMNTLIDAVGWGTAANPFVEGAAAAAPAAGQSIARKPNAHDTHSNAADFQAGAVTPKAAN